MGNHKVGLLFKEFFVFFKARKLWWLAPIMVVLVLLSAVIVTTQGSAILPFIYAGF